MRKRVVTDSPVDNIQQALNLFYIKDHETYVRGGGPAPDYSDVSLFSYTRELIKAHIPDMDLDMDDDNFSMMMAEWLLDGPETEEGLIATLYTAAWAFAELRHRLGTYENLDEQGHLVVLPCRMDATVYDIRRFYKGSKVVRQEVVSGEIDHFTIGEARKPIATVCLQGNEWADYEPDDLILTREEAEAALEGGKDG